jgi:uncharacterized membrane protein
MKGNGMRELDWIREEVRWNLPKIRLKMDSRAGPILVFESNRTKIGFSFCHRRKDRSIRISGYTFPLCARCTGLWLGFVMGLLVRVAGLHIPLILAFVLMLPLTVDGLTQLAGYRESNNRLRLLSGVLFGIATNMIFFWIRL